MINMPPSKIFIVPYRNRMEHKTFFLNYINNVMLDDDYEIYFSTQTDNRPFNRGAMKNLGFLAMKNKYPDYKNISFIFNDVDIMPYTKDVFSYDTTKGVIKHNYGYISCLSASFVIKGEDFEKINGFPNIWTWGLEDNIIQERAIAHNLKIDRTKFSPLGSRRVLQLFDGITRMLSAKPITVTKNQFKHDGLNTLKNIVYDINSQHINISWFDSQFKPEPTIATDIRNLPNNLPKENEKVKFGMARILDQHHVFY